MTAKKIKQIEGRLDKIENVQLRLIGVLERSAEQFDRSRADDLTLLAITNQAATEHATLCAKYEELQELFTEAVRASYSGEHVH